MLIDGIQEEDSINFYGAIAGATSHELVVKLLASRD